jgi:hypothetical protein
LVFVNVVVLRVGGGVTSRPDAFDLLATDADAARTFYANCSAGRLAQKRQDQVRELDHQQRRPITANGTDRPAGAWVPYVVVGNLSKARERAKGLGAKAIQDATDGQDDPASRRRRSLR